MWFIIVENAFVTAGITSDATKFSHLVQLLEPHHLAKVVDVLDLNDYDRLKKQLLHIYTPKVSDKQRAFYQIETIGDRRPSEFYRDLYQIGVDIGVDFKEVYTRWLELLPVECQNIALLLDVEDEEDKYININTNTTRSIRSIKPMIMLHVTKRQVLFQPFRNKFHNFVLLLRQLKVRTTPRTKASILLQELTSIIAVPRWHRTQLAQSLLPQPQRLRMFAGTITSSAPRHVAVVNPAVFKKTELRCGSRAPVYYLKALALSLSSIQHKFSCRHRQRIICSSCIIPSIYNHNIYKCKYVNIVIYIYNQNTIIILYHCFCNYCYCTSLVLLFTLFIDKLTMILP